MRRGCFHILVLLFMLVFPVSGYGGIIRTSIVSHYTVEDPGKIGMEIDISNSGNETAYNVIATIFLADWVQKSENFGNNPPGGKIHFDSQCLSPEMRPGRYMGVIRVSFEEQSGRPHGAYHIFEIPYRMDEVGNEKSLLSLQLSSPPFNPRAFWERRGKIRLFVKNGYTEPIKASMNFYLPDGLSTQEPNRYYELSPGEERGETVALSVERSQTGERPYDVVLWYEHKRFHYSQHLEGKISVEERPVYFWWYVFAGLTVLVILFVVISFRNRRERRGQ